MEYKDIIDKSDDNIPDDKSVGKKEFENGKADEGIPDYFEMKNEYDFSKGIRGRFYKPKKMQKTIRIDDDVLIFFHRLSAIRKIGYQTLINEALRKVMNKETM
ncbi:MAG: BrnA antitoxin family protein [Candidatus Eremiobacteraeota bacterium]|nr:BrnA antitoxin family protein [Candidatus Eremiobacteraeota bacterium]